MPLAVLVALVASPLLQAQEMPGGVGAGMTAWYDAGTGIPQNTINVVADWVPRGGTGGEPLLSRQGTTGSIDTVNGAINFNPALDFNNPTSDGFGRFYGGPATRNQDWITRSNAGSAFAVGVDSDQLAILSRGAGGACTNGDSGRCAVGFRQDVNTNGGTNFGGNPSTLPYAGGLPGNRGPTANLYGLWASGGAGQHRNTRNGWTSTGAGVTKQSFNDYQFRIGSFPGFTKDGLIAEVIYYNRKLTEQEAQRITTYLGVKYGITLDGDATRNNTTNFNYVRSDGTIVWAGNGSTPVSAYHRNVFGLGRDSALDQRIATNINDSGPVGSYPLDVLTVATGALSAPSQFVTGRQSSGPALSQGQYLMVGNDGGSLATTVAATVGGVATAFENGLWSRLTRRWRVQNTGGVGTVSVLFSLPGAAVTALGGNLQNVVLLVDDDGNYGNGGTRIVRAGRAVAGNQLSFNVALANGDIFTLARSTQTLTLVKTTIDAPGSYGFSLTGTSQASGTVSIGANATASVDGDTTVAGIQPFAIPVAGTTVSVSENSLPATVGLTSLVCTNATPGSAAFAPVYDLTARSVSIPADSVNAGASITCTFVNRLRQVDVQVVKSATPNPVVSGAVVGYTLAVTNAGPTDATDVVLTDVVGAGQDCTSPAATASCTATNGASCPSPTIPVASLTGSGITLPLIPAGGQVTIVLQCAVTASGQ